MDVIKYCAAINKIATSLMDNLNTAIPENETMQADVEDIENTQFENSAYSQDLDDFVDDLKQPGFVGVGLEDEGKLHGYLYGYKFIYNDNWDEDSVSDAKWFVDDSNKAIKILKKAAKSGKIMYCSNLAVRPDYRIFLTKMFARFVEKCKANGYKYIAADALSKSYKLLFDFAGSPRKDRLDKFGVQLICTGKISDSSNLIILKIA